MAVAVLFGIIKINTVMGMLDGSYFITAACQLAEQFLQKGGFPGAGLPDNRYNRGHLDILRYCKLYEYYKG
jgi:hypothetical protein